VQLDSLQLHVVPFGGGADEVILGGDDVGLDVLIGLLVLTAVGLALGLKVEK